MIRRRGKCRESQRREEATRQGELKSQIALFTPPILPPFYFLLILSGDVLIPSPVDRFGLQVKKKDGHPPRLLFVDSSGLLRF